MYKFVYIIIFIFLNGMATAQVIDKQGHRGCRGLMPENTIVAMLKAIDLNCTTLELDVVLSADGKVVVSHEAFMNHEIATKPNGEPVTAGEAAMLNLYRMPYGQIRSFDVGMRPHPRFPKQLKTAAFKPTLDTLIQTCDAYAKQQGKPLPKYNIEIKSLIETDGVYHPTPAVFCEQVVALLATLNVQNRYNIQSFDVRVLQYLRKYYPSIPLAYLIEPDEPAAYETLIQSLGFTPEILSPHYSKVTPALIAMAKQYRMKVIPWTVNDLATIQQLIQLGVDGIITDYPNLF
ncbi:MAG TPA: glycerophosphodiester phosphodiesterase [Chitinophagaceae bacterium]|nr:glycerophosphodiester phosphodiesterase [Chitinophagaceae bacterium]HAN38784.1 glycerophosphodiester phosphodiesterase [Chitinophagaceae bacterium]